MLPHYIPEATARRTTNHAVGDAQVAIGILRKAARTAQEEHLDEIPEDVIRKVVPEAKTEIQQKTVDRLTTHQQVLYKIITEHGEIDPRALYDEYRERVSDPKTRRMVRNYLSKLEHYTSSLQKATRRPESTDPYLTLNPLSGAVVVLLGSETYSTLPFSVTKNNFI